MLEISSFSFTTYLISFKQPILIKDKKIFEREGLILTLTSHNLSADGEIAPLAGLHKESFEEAFQQLEALKLIIKGKQFASFADIEQIIAGFNRVFLLYPSVRCGLEMAMFNLLAKSKNLSLGQMLNSNSLMTLPINALLTYEPNQEKLLFKLDKLISTSCSCIKIKLGKQDLTRDIKMINLILNKIPESILLRLDINQAWDVEQFKKFISLVNLKQIEYIEEPVKKFNDLASVINNKSFNIALDESLQEINADNVLLPSYIKALVLKPMVAGGIIPTLKLANSAKKNGQYIVISSAFESVKGLDDLYQLALALHKPGIHAGLGTALYFNNR